jgi:hypothetical protein
MKLTLDWNHSVKLGKFPYTVDLEDIPKTSGIYIFLRMYGETAEALYIGKATNLRGRIKQQLNNFRLLTAIKEASNGQRRLVFGEFVPKPGQKTAAALLLCEKALIRYYLAQGHELVNIQGTKLRYHELDSTRPDLKKFIPLLTKMQIK